MIPRKYSKKIEGSKGGVNQLLQPIGISVVIPNWNGKAFLPSCLNSLLVSIKKTKNTSFEIILVDNASTDHSVSIFKSYMSTNKRHCDPATAGVAISLSSNTGFAYAVNQGIKKAKHNYVCVCNNDLQVDSNWFSEIIKAIQSQTDKKITTFFGLVLNKDGSKIESRGLKFYPFGKAENIDNGLIYPSVIAPRPTPGGSEARQSQPFLIWGASASIVIYHKPTILKVGLFDERFFAYEEDVDLAYRLNKSGFKTLFIPNAISYHLGGGTSSKMGNFRQQMDFKNWILFIAKNYNFKEILANSPAIFIERFRNLSGIIKSTPIHLLPKTLYKVFSQTLFALRNSCAISKIV